MIRTFARPILVLILVGLLAAPTTPFAQTTQPSSLPLAPMVPPADPARETGALLAQQAKPVAGPASASKIPSDKELVGVVDLDALGATKIEASAITDRLREELLKTGKFILVDRSQMNAVLDEQALQQTGCTSQECAVQVGKVLGVRKLISGKITKISETQWVVNVSMVDVETAETVRAESVRQSDYIALLETGITQLAAKLSGAKLDESGRIAAQPQGEESKGVSKWWWVAGGVALLAAAAGGGKGGGGGSKSAGGCGSSCSTINYNW